MLISFQGTISGFNFCLETEIFAFFLFILDFLNVFKKKKKINLGTSASAKLFAKLQVSS